MKRLIFVSQCVDWNQWRYTIGLVEGDTIAVSYVDRVADIMLFVRCLQPARCYVGCKDDATTAEVVAALRSVGISANEEAKAE